MPRYVLGVGNRWCEQTDRIEEPGRQRKNTALDENGWGAEARFVPEITSARLPKQTLDLGVSSTCLVGESYRLSYSELTSGNAERDERMADSRNQRPQSPAGLGV